MLNLSVYISSELERQLLNAARELAERSIIACGNEYNFDGSEAVRRLGLENVKLERNRPVVEKKPREVKIRPAFPLPFNGEFNDNCCYALRQNNGLYTQCQGIRKGDKSFCKACQVLADKNEGTPEYGTIQARLAVDIFEFVDPKGRKPSPYTKVMKKYKVSSEQVLEEAGKLNININEKHFEIIETERRGRPASKKEKTSEPKAPKGRPKKSKKVLEISGDNEVSDLFAALVIDANEEDSDDESVIMPISAKKASISEEEKSAKEAKKAEEKAAKEAKKAEEKAAKESKLAAEKAEKEAKKEAECLEREAKKAALEEEKAAKEAQRLKEKEEKEAKKKATEAKKSVTKPAASAAEDEEEGDRVDTIKVDGKKYLVSSKTSIVYDYNEWKNNQEQIVLGKYNKETQKIEFKSDSDGEESEEEYEEEA